MVDLTADPVGGGHEYTNLEDYDVYLYYKAAGRDPAADRHRAHDVPPGGALIWVLEDGQGARIGPAQPGAADRQGPAGRRVRGWRS